MVPRRKKLSKIKLFENCLTHKNLYKTQLVSTIDADVRVVTDFKSPAVLKEQIKRKACF
jgi:hypothetical protein